MLKILQKSMALEKCVFSKEKLKELGEEANALIKGMPTTFDNLDKMGEIVNNFTMGIVSLGCVASGLYAGLSLYNLFK